MPAATVGAEIKHLMRDKQMPQRQAVAASLSMARAGKFGRPAQRQARRGGRTGGRR